METILEICGGNPGALSVLGQMIMTDVLTATLVEIMKKHNIVGPAIWTTYKQCNADIQEYKTYLLSLS